MVSTVDWKKSGGLTKIPPTPLFLFDTLKGYSYCCCMKIINRIKNKFKKEKMSKKECMFNVGDEVTLVPAPSGRKHSGNSNIIKKGCVFIIQRIDKRVCGQGSPDSQYHLINDLGTIFGWVYSWEMKPGTQTKEVLEENLNSLKCEIKVIKEKISWMDEMGVSEYDETQFKVYQTLKALEDGSLSIKKKTKLIASLINGDC